uniref:Uncharacterized protein n=1 Tax=Ditylenchus dipsaci TaxID=166011 RepID=A0A915DFY2_9BILA
MLPGSAVFRITVNDTATECPMPAGSCLTQEDFTTNLVVRSARPATVLSTDKCRLQLLAKNHPVPIQQWCCCYGDGCNAAIPSPAAAPPNCSS